MSTNFEELMDGVESSAQYYYQNRAKIVELENQVTALLAELREVPQYVALGEVQESRRALSVVVKEVYGTLRDAAAQLYSEFSVRHGSVHQIRKTQQVVYDLDTALAWCKENRPDLVVLDALRFRDFCLELAESDFFTPPNFVEIREETTVTLKSNWYWEDRGEGDEFDE